MKKNAIIIASILSIMIIGFVVAQIISLPVIPPNFQITLGNLPAVNGQVIEVCKYEEGLLLKPNSVEVWSHEPSMIQGMAVINYTFKITMSHCEKSYFQSFEYSPILNPTSQLVILQIQANARQTLLASIRVPDEPRHPIATGSSLI